MYTAVGHLTIDLLPGGGSRAGGTVLFGALAAHLRGVPAHVLTTAAADVEPLLPADAFTVERTDAATTTTFRNRGTDRDRVQELHGWAGPVPVTPVPVTTDVLHLGPVAQELGPEWLAAAPEDAIVVLTPQGLIRSWPPEDDGGPVELVPLDPAWPAALRRRIVVVLNAAELDHAGALADRAVAVGGAVVVTDGHRPAVVRTRAGTTEVAPEQQQLDDDTGAGDVFAAAVGLALADGARLPAAVRAGHAAVAELLPRVHALLPVT